VSLDATRLEPAGPTASLSPPDPAENLDEESSTPQELAAWEQPASSRLLAVADLFATAPADDAAASVPDSPDLFLSDFQPAPLPDLPADLPAESNSGRATPLDPAFATLEPAPSATTALPSLSNVSGSSPDKFNNSQPAGARIPSAPVLPPTALPDLHTISSHSARIDVAAPPAEYQLRQAADRLELARPFGADQDTEAAVSAALAWLARAQSSDGAWNARQFGAGTETFALGENRRGTGDRADTGVTGLALLAFLAGGHTHMGGDYQLTVQRGLESLIRAQMPSGDLSGPKQIGNDASVTNARMYCHGIATLALAEAYALTHDPAVREPLLRAVQYTLAAQDPRGGGWRYRPGDAGDLSQFGWQAMALRSVERSGIRIEAVVRQRMERFLDSCATGAAGGLARYRPFEGAPSPTMTAEALACRLLLNMRHAQLAQREARASLMNNLPGSSEENVYYWYYATLALFQLQDESWQRWNVAMKSQLLRTQKPAYDAESGSWDPDRLWGGYGGRVYSTAMSCMCLEVYYRYLPLYQR
jgi:hypothetical protein